MTTDTRLPDHPSSTGIDAVSLERYSAVRTGDSQLVIYDERRDDAWIQSTVWNDAHALE